jgi:hypothetical protein
MNSFDERYRGGTDMVNQPPHYTDLPPGIGRECVEYIRPLSYTQGAAAKYAFRAGRKGDVTEDLRKCAWYIRDAIKYGTGLYRIGWDLRNTINPSTSIRAELFDLIVSGHCVAALALIDEVLETGTDLDQPN